MAVRPPIRVHFALYHNLTAHRGVVLSEILISLANGEQREGILREDADQRSRIVRDEVAGTMRLLSATGTATLFPDTSSANLRFRAFCRLCLHDRRGIADSDRTRRASGFLAHLRAMRSPLVRYLPKNIEDVELAARIRALLPAEPPVTVSPSLEGASWEEALGAAQPSP